MERPNDGKIAHERGICNDLFTLVFQRESDVEKLQQGQIRAEKRVKALKERMKNMTSGQAPGPRGPDPDEIFEDEEEGNE